MIRHAGGAAIAVRLDVTNAGSVRAGLSAVEAALGGVDILVHNVGWDELVPFLESDV